MIKLHWNSTKYFNPYFFKSGSRKTYIKNNKNLPTIDEFLIRIHDQFKKNGYIHIELLEPRRKGSICKIYPKNWCDIYTTMVKNEINSFNIDEIKKLNLSDKDKKIKKRIFFKKENYEEFKKSFGGILEFEYDFYDNYLFANENNAYCSWVAQCEWYDQSSKTKKIKKIESQNNIVNFLFDYDGEEVYAFNRKSTPNHHLTIYDRLGNIINKNDIVVYIDGKHLINIARVVDFETVYEKMYHLGGEYVENTFAIIQNYKLADGDWVRKKRLLIPESCIILKDDLKNDLMLRQLQYK